MTDNTHAAGENPIGDFEVEFLGEQRSSNSSSRRDLGFTGELGGKWFAVFGDCLWSSPGCRNPDDSKEGFYGMVRDAVSELTDDPLVVNDLHMNDDEPVPHQLQFMPFNEDWGEKNTTGFGGTSIVEVDHDTGTGAVYYLVNKDECYEGAGVAKVELLDGVPTVTHRYGENGWWWNGDTMAKYGDICAYRDVNSEYIYILGNPPNEIQKQGFPNNVYTYQARVRAEDAFELDKYEYWWGREEGWKEEVLTRFDAGTAVMWGAGQGQIVYSEHFKAYMFVHLNVFSSTLSLRFAPLPEGPWSADKDIYTDEPIDGGLVYAGMAYPHLDPSGETLTVGWTNHNRTRIARITFK